MSIKSRVWLFQFIVVAAMAAMAAVTYFSVRAANHHLTKAAMSRSQLEASLQLAIDGNRFSEQIAEFLLIGEPERPDFASARNQTSTSISNLRNVAREEVAMARGPDEKTEEEAQLQRVVEMGRLFREIDLAAERVLLLDREGRGDEAITVFRAEIENQLDAEFQTLIAAAVAEERQEVAMADSEARQVTRWLVIGSIMIVAMLILISLVSGYLFTRSVHRPLKALSDGALAIERGDLDHRIPYLKRDELGFVARRFNAMVEEMGRQRQGLLATSAQLENAVKDRTRELDEANRQLSALDRQRVRFLADVSHELKTPLTVLRGEAEVTLRGSPKTDRVYRAALGNIVACAADMGRLIDDLLFIARSESNEVRFDFRPVQLPSLIAEATQEAAVLARDRRVDIALTGNGQVPVIRGDPRRLKQAFLAVLDNAVKYAEPDSRVLVGVHCVDGEGEVRVHNNGAIIPPEELPHIFERFYRGGNALRNGNVGSGLGLAIARWIVQKHDGTINLSSSPDEGTEVRIRFQSLK